MGSSKDYADMGNLAELAVVRADLELARRKNAELWSIVDSVLLRELEDLDNRERSGRMIPSAKTALLWIKQRLDDERKK
jgi:hypothetical protein